MMKYSWLCLIALLGCNDVVYDIGIEKKDVINLRTADLGPWNMCDTNLPKHATSAQKGILIDNFQLPNYVEMIGRVADVKNRAHYAKGYTLYVNSIKASNIFWLVIHNIPKKIALSIQKDEIVKVSGKPIDCDPINDKEYFLYFTLTNIIISE